MGYIFDLLIVNPMMNGLLLLYGLFGKSYVLAIIVLTIIIRLITLPLTIKQQVSSMKMSAMQPKMKEIQEKYKSNPAQQQAELRKLGFNPLSGCLPLLIQFPILIGLYQAIVRSLALTPLSLLELGQHVYSWLPNLSQLVPIDPYFLGFIDLGSTNHLPSFYAIPILVVATTWLSSKMMQMPSADPQSQQTMQMMNVTMPLMIGFFSLSTPIGLGIYWIASNVLSIIQYYLMKPRMDRLKEQYAVVAPTSGSPSPAVSSKPLFEPPRSKVKVKSTGRVNRSASTNSERPKPSK
jgi:YidC/Oxa1 family membrane protein insertase